MLNKLSLIKPKGFIISLLVMLLATCQTQGVSPTPRVPQRSSQTHNWGLQEIWRVPKLRVFNGNPSRFESIVVTTKQSIIVSTGEEQIRAFSTLTGLPIWQTAADTTTANGIVADANKVYVAYSGFPLKAYDLLTGQLIWSGTRLPPKKLNNLYLYNELIYGYSGGLLQTFSPETGQLLAEEKWDKPINNLFPFMQLGEVDLRQANANSDAVVKVNRKTGREIWQALPDSNSGMSLPFPILHNNNLMVVFGNLDKSLYVFDFTTGQRLWKAKGLFVSNVAIAQDRVLILDENAKLWAFDEVTGTELGVVQFTPAQTTRNASTYWVGADEEGRVFVYFSDSQELMGLAPSTK